MLVATSSAIPHNTRAALWSRTTFCPAVTSFAARGRTNTFCHTRLQTRIAGASHQTDHRAARTFRAAPNVTFFFGWNCALATAWCTFCRLHLPKVFWTPHSFLIFRSANWALATVLCTFCRQLSHIEARTRRNRDPTSAIPGTSLPEKNTGFRARECFHPWIHAFRNCYSSLYAASTRELLLALAWWWHEDMMTRLPLDIRQ
jgi:hypothetical protein